MNISSMECFLMVTENRSFARTARALHISQPAVTKQIQALEKELGVKLFIRTTHHMELTPAGRSFYKDAKEIVRKAQMAVNRAQRQGEAEEVLHIGVSNSPVLFYLQKVLREFYRQYPDVYLNIECLDHKLALNLFLEHKLDILFYYRENLQKEYQIRFTELKKDRLCCLMQANHPLARKDSLRAEDLAEEFLIACSAQDAPLAIDAAQDKILASHSPRKLQYCSSIEVAHCLVGAGVGIALLPGMLCLRSGEFAAVPAEAGEELSFGIFSQEELSQPCQKAFISLASRLL